MTQLDRKLVGRAAAAIGLVLTTLALAALGPDAAAVLRYERAAIAAGAWWRLLTGHLVHLGWAHALLNIVGLAMVGLLVGSALSGRFWVLGLILCALGTSAGLWWFAPSTEWYVGLSGVLHGLLVLGAGARLGQGNKIGWVVLILVAVKITVEQIAGPSTGTAELISGRVIVDAHLFGALTGLLLTPAARWIARGNAPNSTPGDSRSM